MGNSMNTSKAAAANIVEGLVKLGAWLTTQVISRAVSPTLGLAVSLAMVSYFALRKIGIAIKMYDRKNFLETVKNEIIKLELKIDKINEKISILKQAYMEVNDEAKKNSIEEQIRADTICLKNITNRKLYLETLMRAIQVIESYRHEHGDKVDELIDKVIDLSEKATEGKISEKEVNEVITKFSSLIDSEPDFPYVLLTVAEEKLK
ncbi:MAG: hypothetical protein QXY11_03780 [Desulfurococcaceae archaeon]